MTSYTLTTAGLADLFPLHRLERLCFSRQDRYTGLTLVTLLTMPSLVNLKIVTTTGMMVGYVAGDPHPAQDFAWIVTLAVHPAHRRRGLGKRLLTACEARLPVSRVRLTVRESNTAAIALYKGQGYEAVGIQRRYYRGGEDGVLMEKYIAWD